MSFLPLRTITLAGVLLTSACLSLAAPARTADQAWHEASAASNAGPGDLKDKTRGEQLAAMNAREERIRATHLSFYENFPDDPRRWDAALVLLQRNFRFVKSWSPAGEPDVDAAATKAWAAKRHEIEVTMATRFASLPTRIQERFEARPIFEEIGGIFRKLEHEQPVDWASLRVKVFTHLSKYPQEEAAAGVVSRYMGMFERAHSAAETRDEWRAMTTNPVIRKSDLIAKRLEVIERETAKPMDIAFTAVDGREVDLAKMRGKVILIDFWATWCGPCIAELPNVKRVYETYQPHGFEVVGISLENANLKPGDSPEEVARKHAEARKKLMDFCARENLPWPQHYDGKYWENEIARKRFNINAVPATFLIDQSGMVAVVNVRGPQLETEVRKLLKL